jgi:hypothetical protein
MKKLYWTIISIIIIFLSYHFLWIFFLYFNRPSDSLPSFLVNNNLAGIVVHHLYLPNNGTVTLIKANGKKINIFSRGLGIAGDFIPSPAISSFAKDNYVGWHVTLSPDKTYVLGEDGESYDLMKYFPQLKPISFWQIAKNQHLTQIESGGISMNLYNLDHGRMIESVSPSARYYIEEVGQNRYFFYLSSKIDNWKLKFTSDALKKAVDKNFNMQTYEYVWTEDERYIISRDFGQVDYGNLTMGTTSIYAYDIITDKSWKVTPNFPSCKCHIVAALSPTKLIVATSEGTYFEDFTNNQFKKTEILNKMNKFVGIISLDTSFDARLDFDRVNIDSLIKNNNNDLQRKNP